MVRFGSCLLIGLALAYAPVGCSDHEHGESAGPTDALYLGTATDEGLAAFEAATPSDDAARAPALVTPAAGDRVPSGTPIAFTWKATPTSSRPPMRPARPERYAGNSPLGAIRAARAHGNPMNGKAYLLTLRSGGASVLRVFTTNTTYTPDQETWARLVGKDIEAVLSTASFDQNNIVQGSGPFVAPPVAFSIEP